MPPNLLHTLLQSPFELAPRPEPIPGDLRLAWGIAVVVLIVGRSRGKRASLQKLHILAHAVRSRQNREDATQLFNGHVRPVDFIVRVEPWLNRAIAFARAGGLVELQSGKAVRLTKQGVRTFDILYVSDDILTEEKSFIDAVASLATEDAVKKTMRMETSLSILLIRHLRLRAETNAGTFGADLAFKLGLNVLRADNTKGKSTCLQGLLYALGLERMLSPRRDIPLTYVMTTHLEDPETGERHRVLESSVFVELENASGKVITVQRGIVSPTNTKLISVFYGPMLTKPAGHYSQRDFFALDPGAAQREAGFRQDARGVHWLAVTKGKTLRWGRNDTLPRNNFSSTLR